MEVTGNRLIILQGEPGHRWPRSLGIPCMERPAQPLTAQGLLVSLPCRLNFPPYSGTHTFIGEWRACADVFGKDHIENSHPPDKSEFLNHLGSWVVSGRGIVSAEGRVPCEWGAPAAGWPVTS